MENKFFNRISGSASMYFWMIMLAIFTGPGLAAQDSNAVVSDTAAAAIEEPAAPEKPELISPLIDFISVQKSDNTIDLKITMKAKIEGSLTKLIGQPVTFFAISGEEEKQLGEVKTDRNGNAVLNVSPEGL